MSKKTKRKGNLKYSLLLLLLLAILLISSTYAWFTANRTVSISELTVNVQAQNGLQISVDGAEWKSVITNDDITGASYTGCINQIPTTMEALSSAGTVTTTGNLDLFYGVVAPEEGIYSLTSTQEVAPAKGNQGKYIAFDVYFRVDSATTLQLQFANDEGGTAPVGSYVTSVANKGLQNSGRVAFLVQGHVGPGETATDLQNVAEGTADDVYIWEANNASHTAEAVQHATSTYGDAALADGVETTDGVIAEIETPIDLKQANATDNATYFDTATYTVSTAANHVGDEDLLDLEAGVTKVRIYMWVEGQDIDCENNASGSDINFNLQFTIPEVIA